MRKLLLFVFIGLYAATMFGVKVYRSDGTFFILDRAENVFAREVKGRAKSSDESFVLSWDLGAKSIVVDRDGNGDLPLYTLGERPYIIDGKLFWRGSRDVKLLEKKYNLELIEILPDYDDLHMFRVKFGDSALIAEKITESGDGFAFPNLLRETFMNFTPVMPPADPYYEEQWYLKNSGEGTWSTLEGSLTKVDTLTGADIEFEKGIDFLVDEGVSVDDSLKIAVMDSGVMLEHNDLLKTETGYDALEDRDGGQPDTTGIDDMMPAEIMSLAHGTNCAGISAAAGNDIGVTGICSWCGIYPIRYLGGMGGTVIDDEKVLKSFAKLVEDPAIVAVNCSFGPEAGGMIVPVSAASQEGHENFLKNGRGGKGGAIIYAAGNDNADVSYFKLMGHKFSFERNGKAVESKIITVAASTAWDTKTEYSNFGKEIDIAAPSGSHYPSLEMATTAIQGTGEFHDDYTLRFTGTSAAAPVVTGVMGVLLSAYPELTLEEAVDILKNSAEKINPDTGLYDESGHSVKYGYGRVNLHRALRLAAGQNMCQNPAGEELCGNHADDNCDGKVDEGCSKEHGVGDSCEKDSDCVSVEFAEDEVKCLKTLGINTYSDGYCVLDLHNKPCPDGTILHGNSASGEYYCHEECGETKPCARDSYYCSGEKLGLCMPNCASDEECLLDSFCNEDSKCEKNPGEIGSGCASDEECAHNARCFLYYPGGYCTKYCAENDDDYCPTGSRCIQYKSMAGDIELCMKSCSGDSDCRPGEEETFVCHSMISGKEGICYRKCKEDKDCNDEAAVCSDEGRCEKKGSIVEESDDDQGEEKRDDSGGDGDELNVLDDMETDDDRDDKSVADLKSDEDSSNKSGSDGCSCSIIGGGV